MYRGVLAARSLCKVQNGAEVCSSKSCLMHVFDFLSAFGALCINLCSIAFGKHRMQGE